MKTRVLKLSADKKKLVPAKVRTVGFSTLAKRQGVRLIAIRPTVISRILCGRIVERRVAKGDSFEGEFYGECGDAQFAYVYVTIGLAYRKNIPMDFWKVTVNDYTWEAYVAVNVRR